MLSYSWQARLEESSHAMLDPAGSSSCGAGGSLLVPAAGEALEHVQRQSAVWDGISPEPPWSMLLPAAPCGLQGGSAGVAGLWAWLRLSANTHAHTHMTHTHRFTRTHIHAHAHMHTHTHTHACTHARTHTQRVVLPPP